VCVVGQQILRLSGARGQQAAQRVVKYGSSDGAKTKLE
jgi:hypothetical protein